MFKVNNKDTRKYFTPCCSVSIVNLEHLIARWENNCSFLNVDRKM